jgi:hypothetical protein
LLATPPHRAALLARHRHAHVHTRGPGTHTRISYGDGHGHGSSRGDAMRCALLRGDPRVVLAAISSARRISYQRRGLAGRGCGTPPHRRICP